MNIKYSVSPAHSARLAVLVAIVSFVGIMAFHSRPAAAANGVDLSIVLGVPAATPYYPLYVAKAKGYFADEGLNVTINTVDGSNVLQTMASGAADITNGPTAVVIPAVKGTPGFHPVAFFWGFYRSPFYIAAPDGSGIKTAKDLEGKTIGVAQLKVGSEVLAAKQVAKSAGLEPGVDYQFKQVGGGGNALVAFLHDDIDAYAGGFYDISVIKARGFDVHRVKPMSGFVPPTGLGPVAVSHRQPQ